MYTHTVEICSSPPDAKKHRCEGRVTLLPAEPSRVMIDPRRYAWLPSLELPPYCQEPTCTRRGAEAHHIVPRSRTGGPLDYITIDGLVLPNKCNLCWEHHPQLTGLLGGHTARIWYCEGLSWVWFKPERPDFTGDSAVWYSSLPAPAPLVDKLGGVWLPVGPLRGGVAGDG